jgi:hypothetical protein
MPGDLEIFWVSALVNLCGWNYHAQFGMAQTWEGVQWGLAQPGVLMPHLLWQVLCALGYRLIRSGLPEKT